MTAGKTMTAGCSGSCRRSPRVWNNWMGSWRVSKRGSTFFVVIVVLPYLHMKSYSQYFHLGFLNRGPVTIGGPILLCWGGCSMHRTVVSSIPGLYPLDASSTFLLCCNNQKCLQTLPNVSGAREQNFLPTPVANHYFDWCCFCYSFSLVFALASLCIVPLEKWLFKKFTSHCTSVSLYFTFHWTGLNWGSVLYYS